MPKESFFVRNHSWSLAKAPFASEVAAETGIPLFGSIAEALRVGSDTLAVDAVLSIGEGAPM